jgi:curli biogenesis system outer membrane secretion channel CsgG
MRAEQTVTRLKVPSDRVWDTMRSAAFLCIMVAIAGMSSRSSAESTGSGAVKIAVFEFELEDATPAAEYVGKPTTSDESLQKATVAAREQLAGSGRYRIVSVDGVDATQVHDRTLRNCDGCEAAIARKLGAQRSMIGIVNRATQTDYYIAVVIRDASTGKVIDSQAANFAGGEEGWASGVRMLIKHQVLVH